MHDPLPPLEPDLDQPHDPAWSRMLAELRQPAGAPPTTDAAAMARRIVEGEDAARPGWLALAASLLLCAAAGAFIFHATRPRAGGAAALDTALRQRLAIQQGRDWLLTQQEPDGSWDPGRHGGHASFRHGLTGLAALSLLSEKNPPAQALDAALRAGDWLAADAARNPGSRDAAYNDGLGALALVEVAARHPAPALREAAGQSLQRLLRSQQADGGWGYAVAGGPGYDGPFEAISNTAATIWPLRSLQRARELGWPGLDAGIQRGERWLASRRGEDGRVGYRRPGDFPNGWPALTAMAAWTVPTARLPDGLRPADYYGRFFASRVVGGEARARLDRELLGRFHEGLWPADGDPWRLAGGDLYATCCALLSLRDS